MKISTFTISLALAALLAAPAFSQSEGLQGQGRAIVTVLPKSDGTVSTSVTGQDVYLKIDGKMAKITAFKPLQSPDNTLELVLLIDNSAYSSLGTQFGEIESFVKSLPPNIKAAIAYMQNGQATFAGPLSADHTQILRALHLPAGSPGSSASPYFCLSDLAKHWPSQDQAARREVVMVTDGVDPYARRFDPDSPYLQAAISDAVRAHLIVDSIYWGSRDSGSNRRYGNMAGQSYLSMVTQATGGKSFWMGLGNPVSFQPYFNELIRRFRNQYELAFTTGQTGKPQIVELKLKFSAPDAEISAPQKVMVYPEAIALK
jgi:hypothetical protein